MRLKDKGRFGDTEIRVVNGEKAHVNSTEAKIIDRFGKKGQELVASIGSGTINPETGLREYNIVESTATGYKLGGPAGAAAGLGLSLLQSFFGSQSKKKAAEEQAKRNRRYANKLENLANITPSEREYVKRQRRIESEGDPFYNRMMQEEKSSLIGAIRQQGAGNLQQAQGRAIQQGLENSIVAHELARNVNRDTLRAIAEESRRIASKNRYQQEMIRRQASNRAFRMEMGVEGRKRAAAAQAAGIRAGIPSQSEINWNMATELIDAGVDIYSGYQGYDMDWTFGGGSKKNSTSSTLDGSDPPFHITPNRYK